MYVGGLELEEVEGGGGGSRRAGLVREVVQERDAQFFDAHRVLLEKKTCHVPRPSQ